MKTEVEGTEWTCKTIVSVLTPQIAGAMFTCGWTDCRAVNIVPTNMAGTNCGFLTCVVNHPCTVVVQDVILKQEVWTISSTSRLLQCLTSTISLLDLPHPTLFR